MTANLPIACLQFLHEYILVLSLHWKKDKPQFFVRKMQLETKLNSFMAWLKSERLSILAFHIDVIWQLELWGLINMPISLVAGGWWLTNKNIWWRFTILAAANANANSMKMHVLQNPKNTAAFFPMPVAFYNGYRWATLVVYTCETFSTLFFNMFFKACFHRIWVRGNKKWQKKKMKKLEEHTLMAEENLKEISEMM